MSSGDGVDAGRGAAPKRRIQGRLAEAAGATVEGVKSAARRMRA